MNFPKTLIDKGTKPKGLFVLKVMKSPNVYLTRKLHFNAAHRLHNPDLSDKENQEIFGPCNNANGHGHNYVIEITVMGSPNPKSGYVMDIKDIKELVEREVISQVDHKHLNMDVPWLKGINPTAENLAISFWNRLAPKFTSCKLYSIKLFETERNIVEYKGE